MNIFPKLLISFYFILIVASQRQNPLTQKRSLLSEYDANYIKIKTCEIIDFNDYFSEKITSNQKQDWESNKKALKNQRDDNNLESYFSNKDDNDLGTFYNELFIFSLPAFLIAIFSLLIFAFMVFLASCRKVQSSIKKGEEQEKKKVQNQCVKFMNDYGILSLILILCVSIITFGIIVILAIPDIKDSYNMTICTGFDIIFSLLYGGNTDFIGVATLRESVDLILDGNLQDTQKQTTEQLLKVNTEWLQAEKQFLDSITEKSKIPCSSTSCDQCTSPIYSEASKVPRNFEFEGYLWQNGKACSGQDWEANKVTDFLYIDNPNSPQNPEQRDSIYFNNYLPNDLTSFQNENTQMHQDFTQSVQNLSNSSFKLADTSNEGQKEKQMKNGVEDMNNFESYFNEKYTEFNQMKKDKNFHFQALSYTFSISIPIIILIAIFTVPFIMCIKTLNAFRFRKILHTAWISYMILAIISLIFTQYTMMISLGGEQLCEIYDQSITDPIKFDKYSARLGPEIASQVKTCKKEINLQGKTSILESFGILEELQDFQSQREQLQLFQEKNGQNSKLQQETMKKQNNQIETIQKNLQYLLNTQQFTSNFSQEHEHEDLDKAISKINELINQDASCIKDTYSKSENDCQNKPINTFENSQSVNDNFPQCFLVKDNFQKDIHTRYTSCDPNINLKLDNIQKWRQKKDKIVHLKQQQIQALENQLNYQHVLIKDYIQNVQSYNSTVYDLLDFIDNQDYGLLHQDQCNQIGEKMDQLYETLCVGFINSNYNLIYYTGFFSISLLICSIFTFYEQRKIEYKFQSQSKILPMMELERKQLQLETSLPNYTQHNGIMNSSNSAMESLAEFKDDKQQAVNMENQSKIVIRKSKQINDSQIIQESDEISIQGQSKRLNNDNSNQSIVGLQNQTPSKQDIGTSNKFEEDIGIQKHFPSMSMSSSPLKRKRKTLTKRISFNNVKFEQKPMRRKTTTNITK